MKLKQKIVITYLSLLLFPIMAIIKVDSGVLIYGSIIFYLLAFGYFLLTGINNFKKIGGQISLVLAVNLLFIFLYGILSAIHYGAGLILIFNHYLIAASIVYLTILSRPKSFFNLSTIVFIIIAIHGYMFKRFHYPYGGYLIIIGFFGVFIFSLAKFFSPGTKTVYSIVSYLLIIFASFFSPFTLMHWGVPRDFSIIFSVLVFPLIIYALVLLFILNTDVDKDIFGQPKEPEYKLSFD